MPVNSSHHKDHLEQIFRAAVFAVHPAHLIPSVVRVDDDRLQVGEEIFPIGHFENIYVAGAGKATAAMASAVDNILKHRITDGVIAVKDGHAIPLKFIRAIEAGHPVPNINSVIAANEIISLMKKARPKDLVIFLLSGGASSLMTDLPGQCDLNDLNSAFQLLVNSGARIEEINIVRKHLSSIKGGQLVKMAHDAKIVSFIISDVIGNDLSVIGSGPTVADHSTFHEAINVIHKYGLTEKIPPNILTHLKKGIEKLIPENPKPGDPAFKNTVNYIIADIDVAIEAALKEAKKLGYEVSILTNSLQGDAEEAAVQIVKRAESIVASKKQCLIAGGETTVKVKGNGKGGRNQQFALAAAIALKTSAQISLLAAGTDGTDGPTNATGAMVDGNTYLQSRNAGISAEDHLTNNDAYHFFEKAGGHLITGPTHTNVMDIVITLIN